MKKYCYDPRYISSLISSPVSMRPSKFVLKKLIYEWNDGMNLDRLLVFNDYDSAALDLRIKLQNIKYNLDDVLAPPKHERLY